MQWLQKIFSKKVTCKGVVGISFLPHGLTIAVSNYAENNTLKLVHCEFVAIENPADYGGILQQWRINHQLDNYDCHLVLDINDYQRINIEAPAVPVNEMCLAIRWKVAELIDFSIDDVVLDYYHVPVFGEYHDNLEVIICSKATLEPLIKYCTQAGLSLKVIDIQETSVRNIAALLPTNQRGAAVLYLQKSLGLILIQKNSIIYVARKIAIGYEKLDLTSHTGMKTEELSLAMDNQAALFQDNLALEIQRSLDYTERYYHLDDITGLAVIPWDNNTHTLVAKLNHEYHIQAYIMDLFTLMPTDISANYVTQSLCAPAIGATLRQMTTA